MLKLFGFLVVTILFSLYTFRESKKVFISNRPFSSDKARQGREAVSTLCQNKGAEKTGGHTFSSLPK